MRVHGKIELFFNLGRGHSTDIMRKWLITLLRWQVVRVRSCGERRVLHDADIEGKFMAYVILRWMQLSETLFVLIALGK